MSASSDDVFLTFFTKDNDANPNCCQLFRHSMLIRYEGDWAGDGGGAGDGGATWADACCPSNFGRNYLRLAILIQYANDKKCALLTVSFCSIV